MKAMRFISIFSLAAAFCLFSGLSVNTASAEPIEISYANLFPPTHIQSKLPESWCNLLSRRNPFEGIEDLQWGFGRHCRYG
jgi:hypothetical protein